MNAQRLFVAAQVIVASFWGTDLLAQEKYPVRQLTSGPAQEGFPSWSPDGKTIVYSLGQQGDSEKATGLWKVSADGGELSSGSTPIGHPTDATSSLTPRWETASS
jgi:Tol biopolymer transport system component